jgi:hypothetical protein
LHNGGYCKEDGSAKMKCSIECDGGGVNVMWRSPSAILMELGRIRMISCGDAVDDTAVDVTEGKDDRDFLLHRVDDAVCKGLEQ